MQIVLMRHGKPKIERNVRCSAAEFGAWVEQYNAAGIDTECQPPRAAIEHANKSTFTVCSDLARSLESAKALGVERVDLCSPTFREMDLPHAAWHFPSVSPSACLVFFRLAWLCGYSGDVESFKAARARARSCAEQLANLSSTHGTVLFVGHGTLIWFIAKYLKSMGWLCAETPPRRYWEYCVFGREAT